MWPKIDVHTHRSVTGPYHFQKDAQEDREQEATKESNQRQNAKNVSKLESLSYIIESNNPYIEGRKHFTLFFTIDQVVMVLHGDERSEVMVYCVV